MQRAPVIPILFTDQTGETYREPAKIAQAPLDF
jgi:hypothetical protein